MSLTISMLSSFPPPAFDELPAATSPMTWSFGIPSPEYSPMFDLGPSSSPAFQPSVAYQWPNRVAAAAAEEEEEEEEEEEAEGDDCCVCLCHMQPLRAAVVCKRMHTVCHGCLPKLYAARNNYQGGGACPTCRAPLLELDQSHEFGDSLPPNERAMVEAAKASADARFVARLISEQALEQASWRRQQRAREPAAASSPAAAAAPPAPKRKRTMAQYTADIAAEADPVRRAFLTAARVRNQVRGRMNTRAWRRRKLCRDTDIDWTIDERYIELQRVADEWSAANPPPSIEDF